MDIKFKRDSKTDNGLINTGGVDVSSPIKYHEVYYD